MSKLFNLIRTRYRLHKITSEDVWKFVDSNDITADEAVQICGPRPNKGFIGAEYPEEY